MRPYIFCCVLILGTVFINLGAQNKSNGRLTLIKIEDAFNNGDASKISEFIDNKTYISFASEISGYYSYSHTYNMLKDYFKAYKPIKFSFLSKNTNSDSPFGWGEFIYLKNGIRGTHKIFVSLQKSGTDFYISQISIN